MNVNLIPLSDDNKEQCFKLKVAENQMQYIVSNEASFKSAKENLKIARPFVIY